MRETHEICPHRSGATVAEYFREFLAQLQYFSPSRYGSIAVFRMIGVPLTLRHSALVGMRKWHVKDFDNILIFYLPRPDGVLIVRVLHAAQDWWGLWGIEANTKEADPT